MANQLQPAELDQVVDLSNLKEEVRSKIEEEIKKSLQSQKKLANNIKINQANLDQPDGETSANNLGAQASQPVANYPSAEASSATELPQAVTKADSLMPAQSNVSRARPDTTTSAEEPLAESNNDTTVENQAGANGEGNISPNSQPLDQSKTSNDQPVKSDAEPLTDLNSSQQLDSEGDSNSSHDESGSEPTNNSNNQPQLAGPNLDDLQKMGGSGYDTRESPLQTPEETRERLANKQGNKNAMANNDPKNNSKSAKDQTEPASGEKNQSADKDKLSPQEQQEKKQELEKEKLAKKAQRLKMAGAAQKAAGRGMQASGKTMKTTGKGLNQAGQAMVKSGEALSETGLGAIAGVPLMAAGAAAQAAGSGMNVAGEGLDKAGQNQVQAGANLQNLGKQIEQSLGQASKSGSKDQEVKSDDKGSGSLGSGGEEMMKTFSRIQQLMLGLSTGGLTLFLELNARLLGTVVPFLEKLSSYFKPFNLRKLKDIGDLLLCFIIDGVYLVIVFVALSFFSLIAFCSANVGECLAKGFGMPEWMASVVQNLTTWLPGVLGL